MRELREVGERLSYQKQEVRGEERRGFKGMMMMEGEGLKGIEYGIKPINRE